MGPGNLDLIPWVAQGVCASLGECVVPGKDLACPTDALILCSGRNGESFNPQPQEAKTKAQPQPTGLQLDVLPLCPSASSEQIALAGLVPPRSRVRRRTRRPQRPEAESRIWGKSAPKPMAFPLGFALLREYNSKGKGVIVSRTHPKSQRVS